MVQVVGLGFMVQVGGLGFMVQVGGIRANPLCWGFCSTDSARCSSDSMGLGRMRGTLVGYGTDSVGWSTDSAGCNMHSAGSGVKGGRPGKGKHDVY